MRRASVNSGGLKGKTTGWERAILASTNVVLFLIAWEPATSRDINRCSRVANVHMFCQQSGRISLPCGKAGGLTDLPWMNLCCPDWSEYDAASLGRSVKGSWYEMKLSSLLIKIWYCYVDGTSLFKADFVSSMTFVCFCFVFSWQQKWWCFFFFLFSSKPLKEQNAK